ncbi:MAG TPA: hypothetical protein VLV88_04585 [Terriglobales bacterium]|nr:hypothetical protein [Terriglobales bacterium]
MPREDSTRLSQTISGLKASEQAMYLYERIERVESRKEPQDIQPAEVAVSRVIPAGTGIDHISLGLDGHPADSAKYRSDLEKLVKSLEWALETGHDQKEAYEKVEKKIRQRDELIDDTRDAFIFTFVGREMRAGRPLLKYRMDPNPAFKPLNRSAALFSRVKGYIWIDEETSQMARVEGQVIQDISFGLFLGKIYKGSSFMQERYEMAPGLWLPTFSEYDFDGRKFFSSISIHEKTFYSHYRRVGPPSETLPIIRAELARLGASSMNAQGTDP